MREKIEMIDLQLDQKEKVLTCLTKLYQSLEFFYQLANDNNLSKENVKTHMELFESYFTEQSLPKNGKNAIQRFGSCGNSCGKAWQSKAKQLPQIC